MQTTSHILMIRPVNFAFNTETAANNAFQIAGAEEQAQEKALAEFNAFVHVLRENGLDVTLIDDTPEPHTPDSIFPNNWVSFHEDGTVCLYPMYAPNRRQERKPPVLEQVAAKFKINKTIDFSYYENSDLFLEGTGSMVLDRENKIAYACLSPRTDIKVLQVFCEQMGYQAIPFLATDKQGRAIYHTNVMMCVADKYAVVCLEAVSKKEERQKLTASLKKTGKEIIEISFDQMNHFAGNMLQVSNQNGEQLLIMSTQAHESLNPKQLKKLNAYNRIVHSPLGTIEANGGGSARCMLAEIHLPAK